MIRPAPLLCSLALVAGAPAALAEQAAAPAAGMPAGAVAGIAVVTATVEAVDLATREVTLKAEDGKRVKLTVGEEARNLPQLKVGDVVTFEYYQLLALALEPTTSVVRERVEREEVGRTPLGAKPGAYVQKTVDITGTVEAIDTQSRTVTLRGAERSLTLNVDDEVDLSKLTVGQTVLARYVEGFAISARAPEKK